MTYDVITVWDLTVNISIHSTESYSMFKTRNKIAVIIFQDRYIDARCHWKFGLSGKYNVMLNFRF